MNDLAKERVAQILALQNAMQGAWHQLRAHLESRKWALISNLIAAENAETRGRIKELDDLLELPERLQQEAVGLQQPQQEAVEYP